MPVTLYSLVFALALAALLVAAAHDILARTIPHTATALVAVCGIILRTLDGTLGQAAMWTALLLAGCILFWRLGLLGGGDVKLLAAVGLVLPPGQLPATLVGVGASGAVLAVPYILARGRLPRPQPGSRALSLRVRAWRAELFRLRRGGPLPYGMAIAAGVFLSALGLGG